MTTDVDGLTTSQAARLLGLSEQTIRDFVKRGTLPATSTPHGSLIDEAAAHRLATERERQRRERRAGRGSE
jgi:excisionase family DNA binding protein